MRNTEERRMESCKEEIGKLDERCHMCQINGPLSGHQHLGLVLVDGTYLHECLDCNRRQERHTDMVVHFVAKLHSLSFAKPEDTAAMIAV